MEKLRIYIGGDGRAFVNRSLVATDPTPRDHLGLQLMLRDPGPGVYVARPCYYDGASADYCDASLWTSHRYSRGVIGSMAAVVRSIAAEFPQASLTLVGYSGGGVLALFVADELTRIDHVMTVAAPLDIDSWASLHGYTPLTGSMNPAQQRNWRQGLQQTHLAGDADRNVTPALVEGIERVWSRADGVAFVTLPAYDHRCCWVRDWSQLLERFD